MKEESILSVLMYLFKYHMQDSCELNTMEEELLPKLEKAGFHKPTIIQALDWLSNLSQTSEIDPVPQNPASIRVFSEYEREVIDSECLGFILSLEQQGILNAITREMVIHQVLNLAAEGIDISLVKWVTLMVLFNQPNEDNALTCMEYLILNDEVASNKH